MADEAASASRPLLEVENLRVTFDTLDGPVEAVRGATLSVARGETLAIVGESGSGKSQITNATMGLLASNGRATGSVRFDGRELLGAPRSVLDTVRGARATVIFQEPMTSLDPLFRVGRQLALPLMRHGGLGRAEARTRAIELLRRVEIPDPERRIDAYPHELSGGQRQRVMIAMAIANEPDLVIADEPTTALDVTVQKRVIDLLAALKARMGLALMFISHDLNLVRRIADRVCVMRAGEIVETGLVEDVFARPREAYTRALIAAEPRGRKAPPRGTGARLLEARDVSVRYPLRRGWLARGPREFLAVDRVSVALSAGETVGVVGESGSGKSTLGRALLGLQPAGGSIRFEGREIAGVRRLPPKLRRDLQVVFQDPFGSLSPRLTVGEIVTEGLLVHEPAKSRAARDEEAARALEEVGLEGRHRNRYAHEFSGGQRQRIAIARAMILKPRLLVLDEPTSALDRTVQSSIVDLLRRLQAEHDLAYVFISHDLAVVRALSDRVLVMKDGRVVEEGDTDSLFRQPREPYTRELMAAAFPDDTLRATA